MNNNSLELFLTWQQSDNSDKGLKVMKFLKIVTISLFICNSVLAGTFSLKFKTKLSCMDHRGNIRYFAFNTRNILHDWNSSEQEFLNSSTINNYTDEWIQAGKTSGSTIQIDLNRFAGIGTIYFARDIIELKNCEPIKKFPTKGAE